MHILSLCFVPAAFGICYSTFFQALGHGVYSLLVTLLRQVIFLLPSAWIFSRFLGVTGVWIAYPFAEVFSLICSLLMYTHLYKKEVAPMSPSKSVKKPSVKPATEAGL